MSNVTRNSKVNPYDVLLRPIVSEKSNDSRELANKYVFQVKRDANKHDVAAAVEAVFKVTPKNVRTMVIRGKMKRRGTSVTKLPNYKKAIVSLAEGQTIDLFDAQ